MLLVDGYCEQNGTDEAGGARREEGKHRGELPEQASDEGSGCHGPDSAAVPAGFVKADFPVDGMTCNGCVLGTGMALAKVSGVSKAMRPSMRKPRRERRGRSMIPRRRRQHNSWRRSGSSGTSPHRSANRKGAIRAAILRIAADAQGSVLRKLMRQNVSVGPTCGGAVENRGDETAERTLASTLTL